MVACDRMHGNGAHPWEKRWGGLSSAREKDWPGGGEAFHMPPLSVQPAKARALICPGWQWAKLSLVQMNPPDSCETFLKGSPAKGCGGGQLRPGSCITSSHSLTTCCNSPPHIRLNLYANPPSFILAPFGKDKLSIITVIALITWRKWHLYGTNNQRLRL